MSTKIPHISKPASQIQSHYDVVVVGSGYGGGIAASRMSRAGKKVALLEKGKERWPGQYPTQPLSCFSEFQISSTRRHRGKRSGMYHMYVGNGQHAFVANGLGGTSLINANVALRADDRVWMEKIWPKEIIQDKEGMERAYGHAEEMLQPTPYPEYLPTLPKLVALEKQAMHMGEQYHRNFYRPPITVTFDNGVNHAGVRQFRSTLTGNDTTGVNDGSKNSTLMNYIPDAWNHGCEIFCEVDVRRVKYDSNTKKWIIFYEWLGAGRTDYSQYLDYCLFFVTADVLFLAAGTMGTNEILLRSKNFGLPISNRLGQNFSGNGDILAFGYNMDPLVNGVAMGNIYPRLFKHPVGPTITGIIDMRHEVRNVLDGYVIEEGVIPAAIAPFMLKILKSTRAVSARAYRAPHLNLTEKIQHVTRELTTRLLGPYKGSLEHTQAYLIMSHDDNTGELSLDSDMLKVELQDAGKAVRVQKLNETLAKATTALGGTFVPSPAWTVVDKMSLITVHPIGGCNMGKTGADGVVNHKGQVYIDESDKAHQSLYVCDGSIVPIALGVNPFLTISALAERACELAAKDRQWKIDYTLPGKAIDFDRPLKSYSPQTLPKGPIRGGITFTEVMKGYFSTEITSEDYVSAEAQAKSTESRMRFLLTIIASDAEALVELKNHSADITGTVSCRALSPESLIVTAGEFRLFSIEEDRSDTANLMYKLELLSIDGTEYLFEGFKLVDVESPLFAWSQTTTLYVTVSQKKTKSVVGRGILHLTPSDFAVELMTFRATGSNMKERVESVVDFVKFFAWNLADHYLTWALPLEYPGDAPIPKPFYNPRPKPDIWTITAADGVQTRLTRFNGGNKGPVLLIPGAAVTHEIWATDLIEHNFLDCLLENGYDVFMEDHRLSPNMKAVDHQSTLDGMRLDHAANIEKIREVTKCNKIAVVAHCAGSVSFCMGLLDGTIEGVGSVVASNVAMHPITGKVNAIKVRFRLIDIWADLLRQPILGTYTARNDTFLNRVINQLLRFYPLPRGQNCRNAVCKRSSFAFGLLWRHENLTEQFHQHLHEVIGPVNVTAMKHLALMSRRKRVVNARGENVYLTPKNVRVNLDIPILFIHGEKNVCYDLEATKASYDYVTEVNGPDKYERRTFPAYGHLDCWFGSKAYKDVFPVVLKRLEDTKSDYGHGH